MSDDTMAQYYADQQREEEFKDAPLPPPRCSDCKFFKPGPSRKYAQCKRADTEINMALVDGGTPIPEANTLYCFIERDPKFDGASNTCGSKGRFFVREADPF